MSFILFKMVSSFVNKAIFIQRKSSRYTNQHNTLCTTDIYEQKDPAPFTMLSKLKPLEKTGKQIFPSLVKHDRLVITT